MNRVKQLRDHPASPYGPALGSKNPASIAASEKFIKVLMRTAITWRYMETVKSFFSENKNSIYNEKIQEILLVKL
jgi:hypothetical protein